MNIFKGVLTHPRDGEGYLLHNKGTGENPDLILINARGNGDTGVLPAREVADVVG